MGAPQGGEHRFQLSVLRRVLKTRNQPTQPSSEVQNTDNLSIQEDEFEASLGYLVRTCRIGSKESRQGLRGSDVHAAFLYYSPGVVSFNLTL